MKKKVCVLIIALVLSLNLGTIFVSASDAVPYGLTCSCGGNLNGQTKTYSAWVTYASVGCTVKNGYYDSKQRRTVYTTYTCNKCGYKLTQVTGTQERIICPFD